MRCKVLNVFILISSLLVSMSSCNWQKYSSSNKPVTRKCTCSGTSDQNGDNKITANTTSPLPLLRPAPLPDSDKLIPDPCEPFQLPPVPDIIKTPGRRISITKCYEYMWQMRVRKDKADRERQFGWKSVNEFPEWKFMCGSTLISPNFALTAGHCAKADSRDTTIADTVPKVIRFGAEDLILTYVDHPPVDREISKIIKHPKYASPKKYFDIALFQFDEPITFTKYVQPACLWQQDVDHLGETTVTGWGVTSPGDHEGHSYLQAASLDVIKPSTCGDLLKTVCNRLWCGLQDHQFCAGQLAGGVDACQGDSGGPLQMKICLPEKASSEGNLHYVIGVTSFGIGCGKKDIPGVYTKVSHFVDWIESVVWSENK